MAFAPPRKQGTLTSRTRLPVPSPAKKKPHEEQPRAVTATRETHTARVIPSRYLQDARRGPATDATTARRKPTTDTRRPPQSNLTPESTPASPSKRAVSVDETEWRTMLRLRIAHTQRTCEEGELALQQLRQSAESQLTARWSKAREAHLARQGRAREDRLGRDAIELEAMQPEDLLAMDAFLSRVDSLCERTRRLSRDMEAWSRDPWSLPDATCRETIDALVTQCDGARILITPLSTRLEALGAGGIVKGTLDELLAISEVTRRELLLLQEYGRRRWQGKQAEVRRAYEELLIPRVVESSLRLSLA